MKAKLIRFTESIWYPITLIGVVTIVYTALKLAGV